MTKQRRGFAAMSPEKQREIAARGGAAVPAEKRAFSDPALAASAGRKGGHSVRADQRSFSQDPDLAAEAGRKGVAQRRLNQRTKDGETT